MFAARPARRFLRRRLSSRPMTRQLSFLSAWALLAFLVGCSHHDSKTLGTTVQGSAVSVAALQKFSADTPVVLHGQLTEKCPVAGCWFVLRDQTGTIKVDTKHAGFV